MESRTAKMAKNISQRDSAEELAYKDYCKAESDEAYTTITKNQEEYDKQLLTLSTGLLAVLVAFLKDLVHIDESIYRPLLYTGFACFGLTICCVLLSFQISNIALKDVREYWREQRNGNYDYEFPEKQGKRVTKLNWAAGFFFILGVLLSFSFIAVNLHQPQGTRRNQQ